MFSNHPHDCIIMHMIPGAYYVHLMFKMERHPAGMHTAIGRVPDNLSATLYNKYSAARRSFKSILVDGCIMRNCISSTSHRQNGQLWIFSKYGRANIIIILKRITRVAHKDEEEIDVIMSDRCRIFTLLCTHRTRQTSLSSSHRTQLHTTNIFIKWAVNCFLLADDYIYMRVNVHWKVLNDLMGGMMAQKRICVRIAKATSSLISSFRIMLCVCVFEFIGIFSRDAR